MGKWGQQWFDNATDLLQKDLEEELESVRLSRELMQRWPPQYEQLETRAELLRQRVDRLRRLVQTSPDPLEAVQSFPQVAADLAQLRRELSELRGEADRLYQQARADKAAMDDAKSRDIETIRNKLRLENLNAEQLSRYLLGPDLGPKVTVFLDWVGWARRCVPAKRGRSAATPSRGIEVAFPGRRPRPDLLIHTLAVQGQTEIEGSEIAFEGSASGLTSQPELHDHPFRLQLVTRGAAAMQVQAVMDRRHQTPQDRILIDCPALDQAARVLGDPNRLAVTVSPGQTHAWTLLNLHGDGLEGEIVLRQQPVDLQARLAPELAAESLTPLVQQALSHVQSLDVSIGLSGSLSQPRFTLRSNVGGHLADGINRAVAEQLSARSQQLVGAAEKQIAQQVHSFEQRIGAKHDAVLRQVQLGEEEIQRILGRLTGSSNLPEKLLGSDSPLRAILRR
jgi:uncharacterized protein (TIGR03545 family)